LEDEMTAGWIREGRRAVVALVVAGALACGDGLAPGALAAPPEPAYIRGVVTARAAGGAADRVLVETGAPRPEHPVDKAWVTVAPTAALRWKDGRPARADDLTPGRVVSVWVTGPELRSYPVQVTAAFVTLAP
jgi:hypothetical protein